MKLFARTPGGDGLGLDVLLTGQVTERGGKIHRVEVALPIGCHSIVAYCVEVLAETPSGRQLTWADPGDLRADDGSLVDREQIRAEVARVNEQARLDMQSGPLGKNGP